MNFREQQIGEKHFLAWAKCITGVDMSASVDLLKMWNVQKRKKGQHITTPGLLFPSRLDCHFVSVLLSNSFSHPSPLSKFVPLSTVISTSSASALRFIPGTSPRTSASASKAPRSRETQKGHSQPSLCCASIARSGMASMPFL